MRLFQVLWNILRYNHLKGNWLLPIVLMLSICAPSTAQTALSNRCIIHDYSEGFPNCHPQQGLGLPTNITPSLQGVRFLTGSAISPTDAYTYYGTLTRTAKNPSEIDFRVKNLSRALRYDVDNIYEYVHNAIDFSPSFGLKKGARGAVLDEDGTALDQAHLMVDLLRVADDVVNAGYNAKYKIGIVEFTAGNGTLEDALTWLGVSHAKQLCKTLAANGLPVRINNTTNCNNLGLLVTKVEILHVWVEVTIDGQQYVFDPSFKKYNETEPINNLSSVLQFSQSNLLSLARVGMTQPEITVSVTSPIPGEPVFSAGPISTIRKINTSALKAELSGYAGNYANYVRGNFADKHIDDILGARRIIPIHWPKLRQSNLPYLKELKNTWVGEVPDKFRTKITFSLMSANSTNPSTGVSIQGYADDLYARVIYSRHWKADPSPVSIMFEGIEIAKGNLSAPADQFNRQLLKLYTAVDHPYAASGGNYADINSIRELGDNQRNGLIFSMGRVPPNKVRSTPRKSPATGYALGDQFAIGLGHATKLLSNVNSLTILHHHTIGLITTPGSGFSGDNSVHAHDVDSMFSLTSRTEDQTKEAPSKELLASLLSAFEALNASGNSFLAPSGVTMMASALTLDDEQGLPYYLQQAGFTTRVVRILEVDSSNLNAARKHLLDNINAMKIENGGPSYPVSTQHNVAVVDRISEFVNSGYTVYVPERPLIYGEHPIEHTGNPDGLASGACFYMLGSYSCAFPLNFLAVSPDGNTYSNMLGTRKGVEAGISEVGDAGQYIKDSLPESIFASKQVSLSTGKFSMSRTLLKTGSGDTPESLSYALSYNSDSISRGSIYTGYWKSNLIMNYSSSTDLALSFGERGAADASYAVAGIHAATDILSAGSTVSEIEKHLFTQVIVDWIARGVFQGTSSFTVGQNFNAVFVRSPVGSIAAPGNHMKLSSLVEEGYLVRKQIETLGGVKYIFNGIPHNSTNPPNIVEIRYPNGQIINIHWSKIDNPDDPKPGHYVKRYTVTNAFGRSIQTTEIADWENFVKPTGTDIVDDTGRTAKVQSIKALQSPWIQFVDNDGNITRMREVSSGEAYNPTKKLLFTNAKGELVMQVELNYDGIVRSVTDALDNTEHYYIANGWRGEVVNAEGISSINKYNDRGQLIEKVGAERE